MKRDTALAASAASIFQTRPIARQAVLYLMTSDNIEVLGVARYFLSQDAVFGAIDPPLNFADIHRFMIRYTEECILRNRESEWTSTSCLAGHEFVRYVRDIWVGISSANEVAAELVPWLTAIYKNGDEEARRVVQTCILEHLLDLEWMKVAFSCWGSDPMLSRPYDDALRDSSLMGADHAVQEHQP